ncbi:hypothetical protein [Thermophagus xiamenensis]|uniref:Uncharacterized protein n=1 Tax=Thermophagus xiamenensis TaxID=385682 RepID=A0A1I1VSM7_9BACT|nr:hypothetical protein [Thermophagus xiamenensis]SFD85834.1 hypothetical protein SAMN05444380_10342 [Thermophagus xiamenensis]
MKTLEELTRVQYGDYKGDVAVDTQSGTDFLKFCKEKDVDVDNEFPIGFSFGESTTSGIGRKDEVHFTVYTIDKNVAGSNYDEIEKYIKSNSGSIKLKKYYLSIKYSELTKFITRYKVTCFNSMRDIIREVDIIGDDNM